MGGLTAEKRDGEMVDLLDATFQAIKAKAPPPHTAGPSRQTAPVTTETE
jgi:hypothetical protein